jgi:hypothetical protein
MWSSTSGFSSAARRETVYVDEVGFKMRLRYCVFVFLWMYLMFTLFLSISWEETIEKLFLYLQNSLGLIVIQTLVILIV